MRVTLLMTVQRFGRVACRWPAPRDMVKKQQVAGSIDIMEAKPRLALLDGRR
jgi:hypothetical protein